MLVPAVGGALARAKSSGGNLTATWSHESDESSQLQLDRLGGVFTGVVWENGAVLQHRATEVFLLPFGALDPELVARLEATAAFLIRQQGPRRYDGSPSIRWTSNKRSRMPSGN